MSNPHRLSALDVIRTLTLFLGSWVLVSGCFVFGMGDEEAYDPHLNIQVTFSHKLNDSLWSNVAHLSQVSLSDATGVPIEVGEHFNIEDFDQVKDYAKYLRRVMLKDISVAVTENSMDVDVGETSLFLGQLSGTESESHSPVADSEFVLVGKLLGIRGGETSDMQTLADFASEETIINDYLSSLAFSLVLRTELALPPGALSLPEGQIDFTISLNLILVITVV